MLHKTLGQTLLSGVVAYDDFLMFFFKNVSSDMRLVFIQLAPGSIISEIRVCATIIGRRSRG